MFESTAMSTVGGGSGAAQAYLYDAADNTEPTVCVSCRQDGRPSVAFEGFEPLIHGPGLEKLRPPLTLGEHEGQARVFFLSFDRLAPGALDGERNLYEWEHGQVFLLASQPPGLAPPNTPYPYLQFGGASANGDDFFFFTPEALNWEDQDERSSAYDARVSGGFSRPLAPPAPCDSTSEGACQGSASGPRPIPVPATSTFSGPGNQPVKSPHKRKHLKHTRKSHHKHKKKSPKKGGSHARHAYDLGRTEK